MSITSWQTFEIKFENIKATDGPNATSPVFTCLGYEWTVEISTCDDAMLNSLFGAGIVRFYLRRRDVSSTTTPQITWSIALIESHHEHGYGNNMGHANYSAKFIANERHRCGQYLEPPINHDGSLTVEVRMRLAEDERGETTAASEKLFIPANPLTRNILNYKFNNGESADVIFEVDCGCNQRKDTRKKAKISTTTFYAHSLILQEGASSLADMCKPTDGVERTSISIADVKPDIFHHLLYYVYGGKIADEDMKANAKDLIDAADKYGVVNLKLEAEAVYITHETITIDNVIDHLVYGDAKNCALVKEAAMDYLVKHGEEATTKLSFDNVPGSAMKDLLAAMTRDKSEEGDANAISDAAHNYNTMRVNTLRKLLHEKGLDVDGSREMMIARLEVLH